MPDWREEARARCEAAQIPGASYSDLNALKSWNIYDHLDRPLICHEREADCVFDFHARTDLPRALDELDEKDKEIARLRGLVTKIETNPECDCCRRNAGRIEGAHHDF